jgi:hypothetical protein
VIVSRRTALGGVVLTLTMVQLMDARVAADTPALTLRAVAVSDTTAAAPLAIELDRWSSEAERAPLLAAMAPPAPSPAAAPAGAASDAGRGGRGARGAGRGGRGGGAPPNPLARLTAAVKAAPTLGFIWGHGVTGYSIKYAWRAAPENGSERIVLVVDRRLGAHAPEWAARLPPQTGPAGELEFTVIEMRLGAKTGEAKTSLTTNVVLDAAARTVALDGYAAAPALLKVTR